MFKVALLFAAAIAGASATFGVQVQDLVQACQIFYSNPAFYKANGVTAVGAGVCANLVNLKAIVISDEVKLAVIKLYPSLAPEGFRVTAPSITDIQESVTGGELIQAAVDGEAASVDLTAASEAATAGGAFEGNSLSSFNGLVNGTTAADTDVGVQQGIELKNIVKDNASNGGLIATQRVRDAEEAGEVSMDAGVTSSNTDNQRGTEAAGSLSFTGTATGASASQDADLSAGAITGRAIVDSDDESDDDDSDDE